MPYGLLWPLTPPTTVWDFITRLPSFQNHTIMVVVVDHFSKATHFGRLFTSYTTIKVVELFVVMVLDSMACLRA